jgi:hypothetical protein
VKDQPSKPPGQLSDKEKKKLTRRAAIASVITGTGPTIGAIHFIRHHGKHERH